MTAKTSEEIQLIWSHIDPSTDNTMMADSVIQISKCVCMKNFHKCMVVVFRIAGTGSIQQCTAYAATDVAGAGLTAIKSSGSTEATGLVASGYGTNAAGSNNPGGVGNWGAGMIVLDISHDELEATLAGADFITTKCSFATATDEVGVLYILSEPRYAESGLTATGSASDPA